MGFYHIEMKLILKSECEAVFKVRMTKKKFKLNYVLLGFLVFKYCYHFELKQKKNLKFKFIFILLSLLFSNVVVYLFY